MATSTYLTIVNNSIMEAGTDLAFFASDGSDFTSPPTMQHIRFKKWVKDAWRDIQQTAPDWHWSVERATVRLRPRIAFDSATATSDLTTGLPVPFDWTIRPIGSTTPIRTVYLEDGLVRQGSLSSSVAMDCQGYVDLAGDEADVIDWGLDVGTTELYFFLDDVLDTICRLTISGWGSYDFNEATQNMIGRPYVRDGAKQINQKTFRISEYGATVAEGATDSIQTELVFVPWESFQAYGFDLGSNTPGRPRFVTQDFEGRYRFYPALDKDYEIQFDYEKGVQYLTDYDDVPENLPEEFVDLIMWRALQYYGQYDEQPSISNTQGTGRADRNVKIMQQRLERQTREKFHFKPARLW